VPAVFVALGLAGGFPAGPLMSLPSQVLSPATRGLGMGIFFAIYYAAFLVAPGVAGRIADRAGDAGATFLFGAGLVVVSIVCVGLFRRAAARGQPRAQT
jgi:MFS family permease